MTEASSRTTIDERTHVELPLLEQLASLDWTVLDLDRGQTPADSRRSTFTEVVVVPELRASVLRLNPWLEDDQLDEVVNRLVHQQSGGSLVETNRQVAELLVSGTSVSKNRGTGETSPSVRYIDFDDRRNNSFHAICQFKVRIPGTEHHIYPDVVLFLNGLPVVVIECKSPKVVDAMDEAIDQLLRYSEQRGARGEGSQRLFHFNHVVVATSRQQARFGTLTSRSRKHYFRWADPYPLNLNDLDHGSGSPNDQQRLVAGMFAQQNLLDLIRTFTLFAEDDKGERIKVVGRYQQFRAVKLAVSRLLTEQTPRSRSGIVWHTQGSGKSYTMMFMVREMYRHPTLAEWKVVFVTDRTQLEEQLTATSDTVGFTVNVASSIAHLKELLRGTTSDMVMAMIHKFREADFDDPFPELNPSSKVLIMTDEAHRSVYSTLGANLDRGLPNASRIGYTGTPIDKTEQVFGDYIDTYTMRQAIEDEVTLEIVYEGRTHRADLADVDELDAGFEDVFSDHNLEERLAVLGYGSRNAYLEADSTIAAKARDMLQHYVTHVFPNGFKAQVVATSREAAVRYHGALISALDDLVRELADDNPDGLDVSTLQRLRVEVVISGGNNDPLHLKEFSSPSRHRGSIASFKRPFAGGDDGADGSVGILVVNNMLLTGFDAPVEQVLYLDRIVTAHNLLQAIARVNRVGGEGKDRGFVVDYVGVGSHLKRALDTYDEREQRDILQALSSPAEELDKLRRTHGELISWLAEQGISNLEDLDAVFDVFYDEDVRLEFVTKFGQFSKAMNIVLPSRAALEYLPDFKTLALVRALAARHFRDGRLTMRDVPEKLRLLVDRHLISLGVDLRIPPISIMDEDFGRDVQASHTRIQTAAAEVEHAIRHHITVELREDPELQASFAEALRNILADFEANWQDVFDALEQLRERIRLAAQEPTYGLDRKKQMPFFRRLRSEIFGADEDLGEDAIAALVDLTQRIFLEIERELLLVGFWDSIAARNKLIADLQLILLSEPFRVLPGVTANRKIIIARLMELAERNDDVIRYG